MCVAFLCVVRYLSMGLHQKKDFLWPMVYVVKWCSSSSLTWKLKISISKKSLLDSFHPFGDCGHMKICRRVSPIMVYRGASLSHNGVWGATCKSSSSGACDSLHDQERGSKLRESRLSSSISSGMRKANI